MKTLKLITLSLVTFASLTVAQGFWFGKEMTAKSAERKWGHQEFSASVFKTAEMTVRAQMAASLVQKKKQYIGKPLKDIRKELGSYDGYYFTDMIPAYFISRGVEKGEETWQIVFIPDEKYQVKDIIIHRNCCDSY